MEMIDFMEREAVRLLAQVSLEYQRGHDLAYRLMTLLVGGGGATVAYVLGRWGDGENSQVLWALAAMSIWWFIVALLLTYFGLHSNEISDGGSPSVLGTCYLNEGGQYKTIDGTALLESSEADRKATLATRWALLARRDLDIKQHRTVTACRLTALDRAYTAVAFSPAVALLGWLASLEFC